MISYDDVLNLNFYKKEKFTGSFLGMRYRIEKTDGEGENAADVFLATIWPGPYNCAATPDEQKTTATFPFTPEGKEQVVDWLNEQWQAGKDRWVVL